MKHRTKTKALLFGMVLLLGVGVSVAYAGHSWSKYHWNLSTEQTKASPLKLGDNLNTPAWNSSLAGASADWNTSVLKNQVVTGSNTACDPILGQVEVCNSEYGNNNWLGIAQIWVYRGKAGHIAQALVKVNDTYFSLNKYNTAAWRQFVMCQEVGHTFGLGHQDESSSNANLGTCMDYTSDPDGSILGQLDNQHPNQHDYDMLTEIYAHLNSTDGSGPGTGKGNGKGKPAGIGANIDLNNPSEWGRAIRQDAQGKNSLYVRDLGGDEQVFTFVIWAR